MVRCCLMAVFTLLATLPAQAAPLRAILEAEAVVISGLTPNGKAVLLGVARELGEDDHPTARRLLEVLTDEDGDGAVRYVVEGGVPDSSLWAVADLASGDFDTVAPAAFGVRRVNWRGRGIGRRNDGRDAVEDQRRLLELLVVRPQAGAWTLRVGDGDESDGDGVIDGRLEGVLEEMRPVGDGPAPPSVFQKGDLVMALDPMAMEITLMKVPASGEGDRR